MALLSGPQGEGCGEGGGARSCGLPNREEGLVIAEVWAIGVGKGGTGKSFIASSLGLALTAMGRSVVLIDADFGGPNLHSMLGLNHPGRSVTELFEEGVSLGQLITPTSHKGMGLVGGDIQTLDAGNIRFTQKQKLFRHVRELEADYVIMDLGSGATGNVIDLFLWADRKVLTILPELTAIENMYMFVKNAVYRKVSLALGDGAGRTIMREAWQRRSELEIRDLRGLFDYVIRRFPESEAVIRAELEDFTVDVVLNRVRSRAEVGVGASVRSVIIKCFGLGARYAGYVEQDDTIYQCVNSREPYLLKCPTSRTSREIRELAENLMRGAQLRAVGL